MDKLLNLPKNINEDTTIEDLINTEEKLEQCCSLLEELDEQLENLKQQKDYKQKEQIEEEQSLVNQIIDSIKIRIIKLVYKIDKENPGIMDLTLKKLIEKNNDSEINTSSNNQNIINENNNDSEINTNQYTEDAPNNFLEQID